MSLSRRSFALAGAAVLLPATPAFAAPTAEPASDGTEVSISAIDLDGPNITTVTVTVRNTSPKRLRELEVRFSGPVGWTVEPAVRSVRGSYAQGAEATATFELLVPGPTAGFRLLTFTATASYTGGDGLGQATGSRVEQLGEPLPNLAAAYNNIAITDESDTSAGAYDGEGNSFSAQKLADVGLTPGAAVEALGAQLTWPDVQPGSKDNVSCGSQAIALPGTGSKLVFLGSGVGFSAVGSATVYYTDSTSSTGSFGFPNWSFQEPTEHGATLVASSDGRNRPDGYGNAGIAYRIFANSIPLDAGKTVELVVLPGNGAIHVFDLAIAD